MPPKVLVHNFSISLDGFGSGEPQSQEAPFGHAGQRLHEWMFATRFWSELTGDGQDGSTGIDNEFATRHSVGVGAEIMGRRKFTWQTGPGTGLGTEREWKGWWGENPPFHTPVFVLTHHPRPSLAMEGGTVFHFTGAAPADALRLAREAAGELDVRIGGGVSVIRDFLASGLIDVAHIVQVPILLGHGQRLWDGLEALDARYAIDATPSPSGVTHLILTRRD